jgi:hypothetical protein
LGHQDKLTGVVASSNGSARPYNSVKAKEHIANMDYKIRRDAKEQISKINGDLNKKLEFLENDELKRVAWAAELGNDFETMHHIADVMVEKDQKV